MCAGAGAGLPGGGSESRHLDSRLPALWPGPGRVSSLGAEGRGLEAGLGLPQTSWPSSGGPGAVDSSPEAPCWEKTSKAGDKLLLIRRQVHFWVCDQGRRR